jgi:hypothetical protein
MYALAREETEKKHGAQSHGKSQPTATCRCFASTVRQTLLPIQMGLSFVPVKSGCEGVILARPWYAPTPLFFPEAPQFTPCPPCFEIHVPTRGYKLATSHTFGIVARHSQGPGDKVDI